MIEHWVLLLLVYVHERIRVYPLCFYYHIHYSRILCVAEKRCEIICALLSLRSLFSLRLYALDVSGDFVTLYLWQHLGLSFALLIVNA